MIITHCDNSDYVRLCEMSFLAQVGWWEANFATRSFRCSEYINDLLGFDKEEELTSHDAGCRAWECRRFRSREDGFY